MLAKRPAQPPQERSTYSFEQLLGWFGKFTPQFKFKIMGIHRQLSGEGFDTFIRETLGVFRALMIELSRAPKGAERARLSHAMIDREYRALPVGAVSCSSGCAACCRGFPKQITDDEADLLAELVSRGEISIDLAALKAQSAGLASTTESERKKAESAPCLFLDENSRCRAYADRPSTCRKYHVTSPSENCSTTGADVVPKIDLMPELITSAAMSLPDNGIGFMPAQLAKRLLPET